MWLTLSPLFLHPSHQRDTAHRRIDTGRLGARRRFGYWGEQIGHPRSQCGHHAERAGRTLQPRVGLETTMANVDPNSRPATDRKRRTPRSRVRILPPPLQHSSPLHPIVRIDSKNNGSGGKGRCSQFRDATRNHRTNRGFGRGFGGRISRGISSSSLSQVLPRIA